MSDARAILMALGAVLVLSSAVPYMLSIAAGRTRPRIFSWVIWLLLGGIATTAAYSGGELPSAALTAAATVETGSIVALGWRRGIRDFERLDAYCFVGVLVGLTLWAAFDSPLLGLTAALTIDGLAAIPTVRHAWRMPHEEAALPYAMCAVASLCVLAAMPQYTLMGLLYPVYLLTVNAVIAAIIIKVALPGRMFRFARPTIPTVPASPLRTHRYESARPLGAPAAILTYGRHAAPIASGGDLISAAPPTYGRHAAPVATARKHDSPRGVRPMAGELLSTRSSSEPLGLQTPVHRGPGPSPEGSAVRMAAQRPSAR